MPISLAISTTRQQLIHHPGQFLAKNYPIPSHYHCQIHPPTTISLTLMPIIDDLLVLISLGELHTVAFPQIISLNHHEAEAALLHCISRIGIRR